MTLSTMILITMLITLPLAQLSLGDPIPITKQDPDAETTVETNEESKYALYNMNLTEGDLVGDPDWSVIHSWPSPQIPIRLDDEFGSEEILVIEEAMQRIENGTCIRFRPNNQSDTDYLYFTYGNDSRCASYLGYQAAGEQWLELGQPNCWTVGNVMHLLLHTLGLPHEHTRKDRHTVLRMTYRNIVPQASDYFKIHYDQSIYYPYDYYSLMHYSRDAFSKNGQNVIYPRFIIRGWSSRVAMGQRVKLSPYDKIKLRHIYACERNTDTQEP